MGDQMETTKINILISLYRGYGLGDAVQMSAVLRHVAKHRPNWIVDYQAEAGRHCVGRGVVSGATFEYGKNPNPDKNYDAEVQLHLFDTWANWGDRPNTRVSSCLRDRFDMDWDAECGRYVVNVRPEVTAEVRRRWTNFVPQLAHRGKPVVAFHYKGDSSPAHKDLSDAQGSIICESILDLGAVPLVLDWRNTLRSVIHLNCGTTGGTVMSSEWGRDAEYNCAVIRECAAFVGIDSGPSKCASSTDVPSLVVWTGHHPAPFHDPAPNTTHLVPEGYHGLHPVCDSGPVIEWFESHYNVWIYRGDPISEVKKWLAEVMKK